MRDMTTVETVLAGAVLFLFPLGAFAWGKAIGASLKHIKLLRLRRSRGLDFRDGDGRCDFCQYRSAAHVGQIPNGSGLMPSDAAEAVVRAGAPLG